MINSEKIVKPYKGVFGMVEDITERKWSDVAQRKGEDDSRLV